MGDGGEDGMGPPDLAAPDGMVSSGRIKWAPTATLGVQFFRCGGGDKRGEMYAGDAGSCSRIRDRLGPDRHAHHRLHRMGVCRAHLQHSTHSLTQIFVLNARSAGDPLARNV